MWKKFEDIGKKTIYGPGSVTAYLGFRPLLIAGIHYISYTTMTIKNLIMAVILLFPMIVIPEGLLKRKDNKYPFSSAGYYEKFIK